MAGKIDDIDSRILSTIDTDARLTYAKLAKKTGISKSKVQYRLANLMEKGIIKKFVTQPSLNRLDSSLQSSTLSYQARPGKRSSPFSRNSAGRRPSAGWQGRRASGMP